MKLGPDPRYKKHVSITHFSTNRPTSEVSNRRKNQTESIKSSFTSNNESAPAPTSPSIQKSKTQVPADMMSSIKNVNLENSYKEIFTYRTWTLKKQI